MSREVINVGAAPNDGQGDPIRTSFIKTNNNFGELYARAQENPPATLVGTVGDVAGMYAYDSTYFYYCFQDYDGSSVIWAQIPNTVIDAIEIVNGTSNVSIPTANGNVRIGVAGTGNVAVFTGSGAIINGDLTVTGNANLSGNIVGDRITNGTTSIEIPVANGNATVNVAGTANVAVFTANGLIGDIVSATGNLQGGNIVVPNGSRIRGDFSSPPANGRSVFQTTGTGANSTTFITAVPGDNNANVLAAGFGAYSSANFSAAAVFGVYSFANQAAIRSLAIGTANVNPITFLFDTTEVARFTPGGNLGIANTAPVDPLAVTGTAYISGNITGGNLITSGVITATGNIAGANLIAGDGITATGNIFTNGVFLGNGSQLTGMYGNANVVANLAVLASNPISTTGNITGGNLLSGGLISAAGNLVGGNLIMPSGSRIRGDFTSSGNLGRTILQTTSTGVEGQTIISSVPGNNNSNTLASGFGAWTTSDFANSAIFGVYSYANQGAVRSISFGSANTNPITFLIDTAEVARFTTGGNLGIGNASPVDALAVAGNVYVSNNVTAWDTVSGNVILSSAFVRTTAVAFASLPSAATAGAGARSFITDSNDITFAANAAGGGSNAVPVFSDGTVWKIG